MKRLDLCHTVIPFAKCRPIYTLKDLLASCSANVGQYQGIKQEGGGLSPCHHSCSCEIYSKSPPTTHPTSSPRADMNSFPTRVLSAAALLDDTGEAQRGLTKRRYWAPWTIPPDTHSLNTAETIDLETIWIPHTFLALFLVLCDDVLYLTNK